MRWKGIKTIFFGAGIVAAGLCYSCADGQRELLWLETQSSEERELPQSSTQQETVSTSIWVYVCGEVQTPGVYELAAGSRAFEAIQMAGGMTEQAAEEAINLALLLSDGQQLRIPSQEEAQSMNMQVTEEAADGRVHLNTATKTELMELSGIGESKAEAILQYRQEHGNFQSIEEIKNVSGIGDMLFEQIKEFITVE